MSERNNNDSIEELAGQLKRKFNVKNWWGLLAREVKIIEIEAKISVYDVYSNSRYESVAHHAKFFKDQYERQLNTLKGAHTITARHLARWIYYVRRLIR